MNKFASKFARIAIFNIFLFIFLLPGIKLTLVIFFKSNNKNIYNYGIVCTFILIFLLIMLEYSWTYVLFMNPGKLIIEIEKRGVEKILCYPPCKKCGLPKPPRCHHCSQCGCCILYMDHHCETIGSCLGFNNFKVFILVFFYGSVTCAYGAFVLITSLFITEGSRVKQFSLSIILIIFSIGLHFFSSIYIKMSRNNTSTIDTLYPLKQDQKPLPKINYFDKGIWKYIPTPPHIDPYEYLE